MTNPSKPQIRKIDGRWHVIGGTSYEAHLIAMLIMQKLYR